MKQQSDICPLSAPLRRTPLRPLPICVASYLLRFVARLLRVHEGVSPQALVVTGWHAQWYCVTSPAVRSSGWVTAGAPQHRPAPTASSPEAPKCWPRPHRYRRRGRRPASTETRGPTTHPQQRKPRRHDGDRHNTASASALSRPSGHQGGTGRCNQPAASHRAGVRRATHRGPWPHHRRGQGGTQQYSTHSLKKTPGQPPMPHRKGSDSICHSLPEKIKGNGRLTIIATLPPATTTAVQWPSIRGLAGTSVANRRKRPLNLSSRNAASRPALPAAIATLCILAPVAWRDVAPQAVAVTRLREAGH